MREDGEVNKASRRVPGGALSTKSRAGFSVVEVMIVTVLFVVMGAALLVLLVGGQTSFLSSEVSVQAQEEARRALNTVVRDLRGAVNLSCAQNAAKTVIGCPSTRLNFQLAWYDATIPGVVTGDVSGSVRVPGVVIHYAFLPGTPPRLVRYRDAAPGGYVSATPAICDPNANCRVVANNVNNVSFTWDAATRVVTATVGASVGSALLPGGATAGALQTGTLTTRVRLRNSDT